MCFVKLQGEMEFARSPSLLDHKNPFTRNN